MGSDWSVPDHCLSFYFKLIWIWTTRCTNLSIQCLVFYMSHRTTKPIKWPVRPAKTQFSLGIRPVWSESSLCAQWVANDSMFLHADSEDSDQTGRMPRVIWVFAGRTSHFVGFVVRQLIWYKYQITVEFVFQETCFIQFKHFCLFQPECVFGIFLLDNWVNSYRRKCH